MILIIFFWALLQCLSAIFTLPLLLVSPQPVENLIKKKFSQIYYTISIRHESYLIKSLCLIALVLVCNRSHLWLLHFPLWTLIPVIRYIDERVDITFILYIHHQIKRNTVQFNSMEIDDRQKKMLGNVGNVQVFR